MVRLIRVDPVTTLDGTPVDDVAHRADVLRMMVIASRVLIIVKGYRYLHVRRDKGTANRVEGTANRDKGHAAYRV